MKHYTVYCDGACVGNPGPAGWGAVIITPDGQEFEISGFIGRATNQIAELSAAIFALRAIPIGSHVHIHSDSQYLVKGMSEWMPGWKRRGWKTASGSEVANRNFWLDLCDLNEKYKATFKWVKGHNGNPLNERADSLASEAARLLR